MGTWLSPEAKAIKEFAQGLLLDRSGLEALPNLIPDIWDLPNIGGWKSSAKGGCSLHGADGNSYTLVVYVHKINRTWKIVKFEILNFEGEVVMSSGKSVQLIAYRDSHLDPDQPLVLPTVPKGWISQSFSPLKFGEERFPNGGVIYFDPAVVAETDLEHVRGQVERIKQEIWEIVERTQNEQVRVNRQGTFSSAQNVFSWGNFIPMLPNVGDRSDLGKAFSLILLEEARRVLSGVLGARAAFEKNIPSEGVPQGPLSSDGHFHFAPTSAQLIEVKRQREIVLQEAGIVVPVGGAVVWSRWDSLVPIGYSVRVTETAFSYPEPCDGLDGLKTLIEG